jgi:hypothetical protein
MPNEDLGEYYDAVIAAVLASLTRFSEADQGIDLTEAPSAPEAETAGSATELPDPAQPASGMWIPACASGGLRPPPWMRPPPPRLPWGAGIHLVDVERLGQFLLLAFLWHETGDETYVYIVDLREFVDDGYAPDMAEMIITTRLYERVGKGWLRHASLRRVRGLTFIE